MAFVAPINRFHKRIGLETARPFPWFKTPEFIHDKVAATHHFIPFQKPEVFRNTGIKVQLHGVIFG